MADPLSVAGLAAGLVSLGLQVSGGITQYIDALDCREHDIASARQQNDSLHKTLQVIEASLVQLRGDHHAATAAVQACLASCNTELKGLQDLVTELAGPDQPATDRRSKIKSRGRKLLYPFNRPKLQQLETKLRNANTTLQLALQALGLAVSQAEVKQLVTLESTLASHATSHAANLLLVQSEISAINAPLHSIHGALFGFQARFENLENGFDTRLEKMENLVAAATQLLGHNPTIPGHPQKVTPEVFTGRLLAKPGACRDICDAADAADAAGLRTSLAPIAPTSIRSGEASHRTALSSIMSTLICSCRTQRLRQRKDRAWGYLTFSFETVTEQHLPGCPIAQITGANQTQKLGVRYTGLKRLLKSAVQISFAMQSGAGGRSISPGFTYYPTVDAKTAPAFRMIDVLNKAQYYCGWCLQAQQWEKLTRLMLTKMLTLFQTGKASPLAVDYQNRSLLHHLAWLLNRTLRSSSYAECYFANPLLEVLICLAKCGTPANDHDIFGGTPLGEMVGQDYTIRSVQRAASEYILLSGHEMTPVFLSRPRWLRGTIFGQPHETLEFLSSSPDIAQAYGCGPLSLAVLANDHDQVKYLLEHHPATLNERNLFGQSPLHLAADKPSYLCLLAQAADDKLLNETDAFGIPVFEMAVLYSGLRCREGRGRRKCRRCQCAECPVILLKAGCAVPTRRLQPLLDDSSQRCRLRYIRALKDRRDRLKKLATDNLSAAEAQHLGLLGETVLDFHAPQVVRLLQQRGVPVNPVLEGLDTRMWDPVYRQLEDPSDAEIFFRLGFRDTFSWLEEPVSKSWRWSALDLPAVPLVYVEWLHSHGVDALFARTGSHGNGNHLFTAHSTFYIIGSLLGWRTSQLDATSPEWLQELHTAMLRTDLGDNCRCRCSTEGCTPLIYLLKAVCVGDVVTWGPFYQIKPICSFLKLFGAHLDLRHHMASLRFLTFWALDIPHSCCHPLMNRRYSEEDPEDIEGENAYVLELLEKLMEEFESEVAGILEDPGSGLDDIVDFWKRTWRSRVGEVRQHLDGSDLSDDERENAEKIGVVWDQPLPLEPPTRSSNPYDRDTLDHWVYELEKIEAECQ